MPEWIQKLGNNPVDWLLSSEPWTRYRTLTDLLEQPSSDKYVQMAKADMLAHDKIQQLMHDTRDWFPQSVTRHNDATLLHYKLIMLADFGLTVHDPGMAEILQTVKSHTVNGRYAIRQTLPEKGQGFTKPDPDADEWHALPCDSPLITATLVRMGLEDDAGVQAALADLEQLWDTPQGWFCHFFFVDGQFKKHNIGCPMAGLMALQALQNIDAHSAIENAFQPLLGHKELGRSIYYFGRGKKFFTLKYPFVWYNALYLAEVLSQIDTFRDHELTKELVDWVLTQADEKGRFTPTSMFMAYKGWDFTNKKQPSPWMTLLCCRILKRYDENK